MGALDGGISRVFFATIVIAGCTAACGGGAASPSTVVDLGGPVVAGSAADAPTAPPAAGEVAAEPAAPVDADAILGALTTSGIEGSLQEETRPRAPPPVRVMPPSVAAGTTAPRDMHRVVARSLAPARACYQRALADRASVEGNVVLRVSVDADGKVTGAQIARSTLADREVEACLVSMAVRWVFAAPEGGGTVIDVPYTFAGQVPATP